MGSNKKLYRNEENKMIAGVCAGIAEYFSVSINCLNGDSDYQDIEEAYNNIYGYGATLLQTIRSMMRISDRHKEILAENVQLYEEKDTKNQQS